MALRVPAGREHALHGAPRASIPRATLAPSPQAQHLARDPWPPSDRLQVAARYEAQRTDTLNVPKRLPYMHFEHWADFARSAPRGAVLVGVEMGPRRLCRRSGLATRRRALAPLSLTLWPAS